MYDGSGAKEIAREIKEMGKKKRARENVVLMARLEIAELRNAKLKEQRKKRKDSEMQRKLEKLREMDYRKLHPPMKTALPANQLPDDRLFRLNGEKSLPKFFKQMEDEIKIEEQAKEKKPEPRQMGRVLNYLKNEIDE